MALGGWIFSLGENESGAKKMAEGIYFSGFSYKHMSGLTKSGRKIFCLCGKDCQMNYEFACDWLKKNDLN